MRTVQIFMLAAIFGWCFSTTQVVGKDTKSAEMPADSIIAPNVFSPNREGTNALFTVKSREGNTVSLKVFDRFGTLVFSEEAIECSWNGRSLNGQIMSEGIYVFRAEVLNVSPKITKIGEVLLLDEKLTVKEMTPADIIIAPNVFSPNREGANALFTVKSREGNTVSLKVFNRFGTLVFSEEAIECRWDGRLLNGQIMSEGIYVFRAEVLNVSPKITKIGEVLLLDEKLTDKRE